MDNSLWCITTFFNPSGYRSRLENYYVFRDRLEEQNIPLLTIELAFNDQPFVLSDSVQLRSHSILWQKERLLNYALSLLKCEYVCWVDADILLPNGWDDLVKEKLEEVRFVQPYEQVAHLAPEERFGGERLDTKNGIVWQKKTYGDRWLELRKEKKIFHAEPGFVWAARKEGLNFYDRMIVGGGDNFIVDCLLNSFSLHHYADNRTSHMEKDMETWDIGEKSVDYLPLEVFHLWHGSPKDRGYLTRDLILQRHDFDPQMDIRLENNVYEWASDKLELHRDVEDYFRGRNEDG